MKSSGLNKAGISPAHVRKQRNRKWLPYKIEIHLYEMGLLGVALKLVGLFATEQVMLGITRVMFTESTSSVRF